MYKRIDTKEYDDVVNKYNDIRKENIALRQEIARLREDNSKYDTMVIEKDREIKELKERIDSIYVRGGNLE